MLSFQVARAASGESGAEDVAAILQNFLELERQAKLAAHAAREDRNNRKSNLQVVPARAMRIS